METLCSVTLTETTTMRPNSTHNSQMQVNSEFLVLDIARFIPHYEQNAHSETDNLKPIILAEHIPPSLKHSCHIPAFVRNPKKLRFFSGTTPTCGWAVLQTFQMNILPPPEG
jgi:hypothetical protein